MKNLNGMMGGVQFVPGFGFVQDNGGGAVGNLGNESDVMMISGLGDNVGSGDSAVLRQGVSQSQGVSVIAGSFSQLKLALGEPYTFFGIKLPLWVWLLIAAGALGAGAVFFNKKYKLFKL